MPNLNQIIKLLGIEEIRDLSKDKVAEAIAKKIGEVVEKEAKPYVQAALKHEAVDKILDSLSNINNPTLRNIIIELRKEYKNGK